MDEEERRGRFQEIARELGLRLLVLYGSRARGDDHPRSDWDFAFLAGEAHAVDPLDLLSRLVDVVGTDSVDLVDLARAGALLRARVARDGVLLFEPRAGLFASFRFEATRFYCEIEPVLRRAHDRVIERLLSEAK